MVKYQWLWPLLASSFLSSSVFAQAETATTVITTTPTTTTTERRIVTSVPAPKEIIVAPAGFTNCFTIKEGWFDDKWIPEHRVCRYANASEGDIWIEGYWACDKYNLDSGECTNWVWREPRWTSSIEVY